MFAAARVGMAGGLAWLYVRQEAGRSMNERICMAAETSKAVKMMMCQGGLVNRQCWNGEERKADRQRIPRRTKFASAKLMR